jgi:hypothetical protein
MPNCGQMFDAPSQRHRNSCSNDLYNFESSQLADTVTVEPVSASQFPANREKNREFCVFEPGLTPPALI